MSETTMYYLGTGTEFIKAQCKPYKTIEGALKAAAKDESLVVWDENGNVIGSLTDNVPDGALATNADGSVNSYNADGQQVGVATAATVAAVTGNEPQGDTEGENASQGTDEPTNGENGENEANAQPQSTGGENMMQQGDAETVENGTEKTLSRQILSRMQERTRMGRMHSHRAPEEKMCNRAMNRNGLRNRPDDSTSRLCVRAVSD